MSASAKGPLVISIKAIPTFILFKSRVRNMLQKYSFYSIDDFFNCESLS